MHLLFISLDEKGKICTEVKMHFTEKMHGLGLEKKAQKMEMKFKKSSNSSARKKRK